MECRQCLGHTDTQTHSCQQSHFAPSLEQRVLRHMGLCLKEGHRQGASSWQQGCLQTCTRRWLLVVLLLLQLSTVLLVLHGRLQLRWEERRELPGADMCNTYTKHTSLLLYSCKQLYCLLDCLLSALSFLQEAQL